MKLCWKALNPKAQAQNLPARLFWSPFHHNITYKYLDFIHWKRHIFADITILSKPNFSHKILENSRLWRNQNALLEKSWWSQKLFSSKILKAEQTFCFQRRRLHFYPKRNRRRLVDVFWGSSKVEHSTNGIMLISVLPHHESSQENKICAGLSRGGTSPWFLSLRWAWAFSF